MSRPPPTIEDLYAIKLVADPNIAPDGRRVAYVVTTVDKERDGYRSAIWVANTDGSGEARQFTSGRKQDSSPRWSPDGRYLAFLSDRNERKQLWGMPGDGGEAWQLTDGPNAVSDIAWSAGSRALAYVTKVEPEQAAGERQSDVRVIRALHYKADGEGFLDGKRKHIFLVDIDGGPPRQLTDGDWDCIQPALSPDGTRLAFTSDRSDDRDDMPASDVWVADLATGALQRVTGEDGAYATPAWSPDSRQLAYVGHPIVAPYGPTTADDLYVWDTASGATCRLLGALDREPGNSAIADARFHVPTQFPVWDADGSRLYGLVSDRGSVHVYECALDEPPAPLAAGERDIQSFTLARDGTLAFAAGTMTLPSEVFVRRTDGAEQQLSRVNAALLDELDLPATEEVRFTSDPNVEVHGWLLKPPGFNPNVKYPAIVQIHGGPHGMYGSGFFHEMQVLAARGYVVLFTNPRGSTGYGQAFVADAQGDWGGADYRDVMAGVPFLESLSYVDPQRLGVTGGSYGGYMVNWIIGQTPRFTAAVTQRSTCNRMSLYGTSDLNYSYNDWEYRGSPYDNPAFYLERSPLTYVKNVTTPLLILHSEQDLRCPISQGEELFVALKKLGKDVELVRFPDESHNLSRSGKPSHRVERLERLCGWFDTHV
jgi:dipeptidyl aminopeptidase/acylaminoacyl peptidase